MAALGEKYVNTHSPSNALKMSRTSVRWLAPAGQHREQAKWIVESLCKNQLSLAAAIVQLARVIGMRCAKPFSPIYRAYSA